MKYLTVGLFLLMSVIAWAQAPVVDGVLGANEYSRTETKSGLTVAASLSLDGTILHLAVKAKTAGWVSIGAGSQMMDKAFMVLAHVAGTTQTITEETGKGKGHSVNTAKLLKTAFVAEASDFTTLEIALPATGFIKEKAIELIAAFGAQDNRTSMHRARASFKLSF